MKFNFRQPCFVVPLFILAAVLIMLFMPAAPTLASSASCTGATHDDYDYIHSLAESGNALAEYQLSKVYASPKAYDYLFGNGTSPVAPDARKELQWLHRSAHAGYAKAQFELGLHLLSAPENNTTALEWFQKAADQGERSAQSRLALMYEKGQGATANLQKAYFWSFLATNGLDDGTGALKRIAPQLTSEQLAAEQARVRAWHPSATGPDDSIPLLNIQALVCGDSSWGCTSADSCGHYIGISCPNHGYYFADTTTNTIVAFCGPWAGKGCTVPRQWACGWPKKAPTDAEAQRFLGKQRE